jgi:hypothetical protein
MIEIVAILMSIWFLVTAISSGRMTRLNGEALNQRIEAARRHSSVLATTLRAPRGVALTSLLASLTCLAILAADVAESSRFASLAVMLLIAAVIAGALTVSAAWRGFPRLLLHSSLRDKV